MKKLRALLRTGRFLLPVTLFIEEPGVVRALPRAEMSEVFKIKGSLSSKELSALMVNGLEVLLEGCEFSIRRSKRSMEVLDGYERKLLDVLGVDIDKLIKESSKVYREVYIVKIVKGGDTLTLIADRRTALVLGKYLAKHCEETIA